MVEHGLSRHRRPVHAPGQRPGGDGRERTVGHRDPGGPARCGHRARPLRRRRPLAAASRRRIARRCKPETRVFACEVATAAPLAASLAAGTPQTIDYTPSFVDGIGGKSVLAEMWPLANAAAGRCAGGAAGGRGGGGAGAGGAQPRDRRGRRGDARWPPRWRGWRARARSSASISGGNIDAAKLGHILLGEMLGTHPPEPVKAKAQSGRGRRTAAARAAAAPADAQPEPEASVAPAAEVPTTAKAPRKRATRAKAPAGA